MSEITVNGNKVIVKPGKDVVASMIEDLKMEFRQILNDGVIEIAVDLSGATIMDSMGIGLLVATHNSLQKNGNKLELINVSADILKLLKSMRLDQHFNINET